MLHKILYSRQGNENWTTPHYPIGVYVPGEVDLQARGHFCFNSGDDRLIEAELYEVRDIDLPDWLDPNEWARRYERWKYCWGIGVNPEWPETWQRGLLYLTCAERLACVQLLRTKKFRSPFRASLHEQLLNWLETPSEERTYGNPFSGSQWDSLITARIMMEAKRMSESLYWAR